jgi:peptide/nickel transport system substrate-binding protein
MTSITTPVTRRQFVRRLGGATLLVGTLAACAPIGAPTPTQPPSGAAPAPAKPAAAPTQGPSQGPSSTAAPAAPKPTEVAKPAAAAPTAAAKPAAEPKRGGTLRYAHPGIRGKDPHPLGADQYGMVNLVWDTPIRFDAKLQPTPWLAESFELSQDSLGLTLRMRKGVTFHTGREMMAEDVRFNVERVRKPETASQMRFGAEKITAIELPDPYTITLKFAEPNPAIWDMLETLYIVDKENIDNKEFQKGVGTGPFTWVDWRPGERLVVERNPSYWMPGLPYLDRVELVTMPDAQAKVVSLEAGGLEVAEQPPDPDLVRLRQGGTFQAVVSEFWSDFYYLGAVVNSPPTDSQKLRQAVNYAINRQRFVETALAGVGEAQAIPWPKNSPAYDAEQAAAFKFDLEKAKQLVQESGVSNPSVSITASSGISPNWTALAELVQADLGTIGIIATIDKVEPAIWRDRLTNRKMQGLWTGQFGFSHMHPSTMSTLAFPWRVGGNTSNYASDRYSSLVRAASVTVDPVEAKKIYRDLTQLILDESFMMTVSPQKRTWLLAPNVRDFAFGIGNYPYLEKCWIDR